MKLLPVSFRLPLVLLLALLLSMQSLAWGFVLCVGEDGHSAFEQAVVGKCVPAELPSAGGDEIFCTDDHCGPCLDIATPFDSLQGRSRGDHDLPLLAQPPSLSALYSSGPDIFIRDLTANLQPQPPPRPTNALISLRTIVLRN